MLDYAVQTSIEREIAQLPNVGSSYRATLRSDNPALFLNPAGGVYPQGLAGDFRFVM